MTHGGARAGAGRPKGRQNSRRLSIVDKAHRDGKTPLEVMLFVMRWHFDAERYQEAASVAKDAAPYVHPKLATIQQQQSLEVTIKDEAAMTPEAVEIEGVYEAAKEHGVVIDNDDATA